MLNSKCILIIIGVLAAIPSFAANKKCADRLENKQEFSATPKPEQVARTGNTLVLWSNGKPSSEYRDLMKSAQPGDVLDFGNADRYTLARRLGHGASTWIVKVSEGFVLRIPRFYRDFGGVLTGEIEDFVTYHRKLTDLGLELVKLDLKRSRAPRFLIVEELDIEFTLDQFNAINLYKGETWEIQAAAVPAQERKKLWDKFLEMVPLTWAFKRMANFSGCQIGWVKDRWVIFDIESPHTFIGQLDDNETTFDPVKYTDDLGKSVDQILPEKLLAEVRKLTLTERARQAKNHDWFQRTPDWLRPQRWMLQHLYRMDKMEGKTIGLVKNQIWGWEVFEPGEEVPTQMKYGFTIIKEVTRNKHSLIFEVQLLETGLAAFLELQISAEYGKERDCKWQTGEWGPPGKIQLGDDFRLYKK